MCVAGMSLVCGHWFEAQITLAAMMPPLVSIRCRSQRARCRTDCRMFAQFNVVQKLGTAFLAIDERTFSYDYRHRSIDGHYDLLMISADHMLCHGLVVAAFEFAECAPEDAGPSTLLPMLGRMPVAQEHLVGVGVEVTRLTLERWLQHNLMDVLENCIVSCAGIFGHGHATIMKMWNQMFAEQIATQTWFTHATSNVCATTMTFLLAGGCICTNFTFHFNWLRSFLAVSSTRWCWWCVCVGDRSHIGQVGQRESRCLQIGFRLGSFRMEFGTEMSFVNGLWWEFAFAGDGDGRRWIIKSINCGLTFTYDCMRCTKMISLGPIVPSSCSSF